LDNLVLASVVRELAAAWTGAVFEELRQDSGTRFRLRFASGGSNALIAVSVRAEAPWIGSPSRRWEGPRWSPDPFVGVASRALAGRRVERVLKLPVERSLTIGFTGDLALVVELAPHGGNLVLLEEGRVVAALRKSRATASRLAAGAVYQPRPSPPRGVDPFGLSAEEIDAIVAASRRAGEPDLEILRRDLRGVGTEGASLVLAEAEASGETLGTVLERRLARAAAGEGRPCLVAPERPWEAVTRGSFDARFRLLPWEPLPGVTVVVNAGGPAAIAGLYHECAEAAEQLGARLRSLAGLTRAEASRAEAGERRAREDASGFARGQELGRKAEALLAGLSTASRRGASVFVPDPYAPDGEPVEIEAPPGVPLTRIAEDLFGKQRRARRGAEAAARRAEAMRARSEALGGVLVRLEGAASEADASEIESALRALGVPVGLARSARQARAQVAVGRPSLPGVRVVTSRDGFTILVGQTGRDNDRLTFKIAAPEDVWLHASGVPGAHVVIRTAERGGAVPPRATLEEAARLAAWFSDARGNAVADVQWTRRKNVRRARGAAPGTVLVKRFEVLRVRPGPIDPREGVP